MKSNRIITMNIRRKIALQMVLVSLIPLLLIASFAYISMGRVQASTSESIADSRAEMEHNVVAVNLQNQALSMGLELTSFLRDHIVDMVQVMSTPCVIQMLMGQGTVSVVDLYLNNQIQILGSFTELTITDVSGVVAASTNPDHYRGLDLAKKSWWQSEYYTTIRTSSEDHTVEMILWFPIPNPLAPGDTDQALGWIMGISPMASIMDTSKYADRLEQGRMVIFFAHQLLSDSENKDRPFRENPGLTYVEQAALASADAQTSKATIDTGLPTVSGFVIDDEHDVVAGYFRPGSAEFRDMIPEQFVHTLRDSQYGIEILDIVGSALILMQQPTDVAFAALDSMVQLQRDLEDNTGKIMLMLAAFFFGTIVVAQLMSYWGSRGITRPIFDLQHGVTEIMSGNMYYRVGNDRSDEIGQLSRAFDQMTASLHSTRQDLEQRTLNLQEKNEELIATEEDLKDINKNLNAEIADRRKAEKALQKAHDEMETQVLERTRQLQLSNNELQNKIAEREVLLKEIHHRVKNNLQIVSSLLDLQSSGMSDQDTLAKFADSQNRVRSMALIHEKLYQSQDIAKINFAEYVNNLANYLFQSYGAALGGIAFEISIEDVFLDIDTAIPCGLIVNELISNSLKYAFPNKHDGDKIVSIAFNCIDNQEYHMTVRDSGIGVPEDVDIFNTGSLGLQLVSTLVDQLEGTLKVENNGGTTFTIIFRQYSDMGVQHDEEPAHISG